MSTQQQKIHVKLQHNNEFRRFIIEPHTQFNDLKQNITTLLHLTTPFSIRYQDEESEWITIESDNELLTGIELSPKLLRLRIEPVHQPESSLVPTENIEEKGCKKWKKHGRKFRDEGCDDTMSEEKGCKKWKNSKKMKKFQEECNDETSGGEKGYKKWKKHCKKFGDEKDCGDVEKKCHGKWREEKFGEENSETERKCHGKWRKWREENGEPEGRETWGPRGRRYGCPRGGRGGLRGGRGGWRKFLGMEDDSDSIEETRPVEEIKKEINSLKEEVGALVTKKKALWEELVVLKTQIKNLRQNGGAGDEILKVREQIMEKKKVCRGYHGQIAHSKNRIWKLKNALVMRVD